MAAPGVLLAQLFNSIACFGSTFHMKGPFAVMTDDVLFFVLLAFWSLLGVSGCHIKGGPSWRRQHERWWEGG